MRGLTRISFSIARMQVERALCAHASGDWTFFDALKRTEFGFQGGEDGN
jgi:hypothetical protein